MTTKNTYRLTGNLISESHLATCGPSLAEAARKFNKNAPTPVPTFENSSGKFMNMPGPGLRSKLRGAACALVLEALEKRGSRRFSLVDANFNRVGGIKQGGAESALDWKSNQKMIDANPILGLFGASTPWVKGKVMIGALICKDPELRPMRVDGVRSDIIRREPGIMEFLDSASTQAYNADIERTKAYSQVKAEIRDLEAKLKAKTSTAEDRKKAKDAIAALEGRIKEQNLKHVSAQQPLAGYEAIPPGTELDNKIHLVGGSELELGALIASIARFAENPVLGAHSAHGAGVVRGEWTVEQTGKGVIGTLKIDPFMELIIHGQDLLNAKLAFEAFIASDDCIPYSDPASLMKEAEGAEGNE